MIIARSKYAHQRVKAETPTTGRLVSSEPPAEAGRVCKKKGCGTILSRWNTNKYCSVHGGSNLPLKDELTCEQMRQEIAGENRLAILRAMKPGKAYRSKEIALLIGENPLSMSARFTAAAKKGYIEQVGVVKARAPGVGTRPVAKWRITEKGLRVAKG